MAPAAETTRSLVTAAIAGRRSIRDFDDKPIEPEVLEEILLCGLMAPSSKNAMPWRLHVTQNRDLLGDIADAMISAEGTDQYVPHDPLTGEPWPGYASTVEESAIALREAAAAVFIENIGVFIRGRDVLATAPPPRLAGSLVAYGLEVIGIGTAIENMWIAATALGVSGTFMGDVIIAEQEVRDVLSIEGDLMGVIALGYSSAGPPYEKRPPDPRTDDRVGWH